MKFQKKLHPRTIVQILFHPWKFTIGLSASCYTHWFKCQCSRPSYLFTLNVWHEQGHWGWRGLVIHELRQREHAEKVWLVINFVACSNLSAIWIKCSKIIYEHLRTSQTHLWHQIYQTDDNEDNKNFSNPFAEHQIYIARCWQILRHSSSAFWRCGNGFCSLNNL